MNDEEFGDEVRANAELLSPEKLRLLVELSEAQILARQQQVRRAEDSLSYWREVHRIRKEVLDKREPANG